MKTLFLAWQNPISRTWFPIGRLTFDGGLYRFCYIQGVTTAQQEGDFESLWAFPELEAVYKSRELFPLFANRLLRRSRPEYSDFVQWLNIPQHEDNDPIALLSRSGGQRATDSFEVFPCPERDEKGQYHIHFFSHGVRHLPPETQPRINQLQPNERLYIAHDLQNPYDAKALLLRTEDKYMVGYCPRYFVDDFFDLLRNAPNKLEILVEKVNPSPTPSQFRLLCNLTAEWAENFQPFSGNTYQPLAKEELNVLV
ncbi:MAG: HIRAN domain-containing protein [Cyanobacteria bacterium J06597_16]